MSCVGCKYTIGKEATCPQTYACNTSGDKPAPKEENKKTNKKERTH